MLRQALIRNNSTGNNREPPLPPEESFLDRFASQLTVHWRKSICRDLGEALKTLEKAYRPQEDKPFKTVVIHNAFQQVARDVAALKSKIELGGIEGVKISLTALRTIQTLPALKLESPDR